MTDAQRLRRVAWFRRNRIVFVMTMAGHVGRTAPQTDGDVSFSIPFSAWDSDRWTAPATEWMKQRARDHVGVPPASADVAP